MKYKKTDIQAFEVNKPSSQISTTYMLNNKPHVITPFQFDAMNFICYQARKQISEKYNLTKKGNHPINTSNKLKIEQIEQINGVINIEDDLFTMLRSELIQIDIAELSEFTGKYKNNHKKDLIKAIEILKSIRKIGKRR